jgi:hypothetical protein
MNFSLKGIGVFPRKLYAMLLLSAMVTTGMAQTAPTTPTAPTATVIPTGIQATDANFMAGVTTALSNATTNIVYIQQSGSTPTVSITQDGNSNKIGYGAGTANPVMLNGDNQTVNIVQSGNLNSVNTLALTTTSGSSTVSLLQNGNSNSANITCITCNAFKANWQFTGDNNSLNFSGNGANLISGANVAGNGNILNSLMTGDGHQQLVNVSGDNNTINLTQTSATASSINLAQTGTGTTFNISQSGSYSNVANVQATANGGSFNITQHSH